MLCYTRPIPGQGASRFAHSERRESQSISAGHEADQTVHVDHIATAEAANQEHQPADEATGAIARVRRRQSNQQPSAVRRRVRERTVCAVLRRFGCGGVLPERGQLLHHVGGEGHHAQTTLYGELGAVIV